MRIISFGDLYIDYYFSNDLLLGICGGKSNANIIANLSRYYDTAFIGAVGNDTQGAIAIHSLKRLGVDVSNIYQVEGHTKSFFINSSGYQKDCPYCGRTLFYHGLKTDFENIPNYICEDDIVIIDNVNPSTLDVLNKIKNTAFIDIGYLGNLMYDSLEEIETKLANRFAIINMNERVYKVIRQKFGIDSLDLYELLHPDLLIITKGAKGSDIIYDGILLEKEIENPISTIESSGAGDAFFSEFIHTYLENNGEMNEKNISLAYMRASSISSFVVSNYGARTHLEPLYKITEYGSCICDDIEYNNL